MSSPLWGEEHSFDPLLLSMMQSCGKVQNFMDSIFSFLSRRTDFYIIMDHDQAGMGFKPGAAMNMVIQAFKKYEILTRKKEAELQREAETRRIDLMTDDLSKEPPVDVSKSTKEELSKLEKLKTALPSELKETQKKEAPSPSSVPTTPASKPEPKKPKQDSSSPPPLDSDLTNLLAPPSKEPIMTPPRKEDESLKLSSDAYNGSKTDRYVWCQTVTDLDLRVPIPRGTTGKDLKVDMKSDFLKVELLRPQREIILLGRLLHRVKVEESIWTIHKGGDQTEIQINLEKTKEVMWKSVFEGEDGIDLSKVDNSRNINDFDQEAQVAIERVTYDHHMKMMGKPTSSEQKAHDILRKAWDAPGSPFAGTPFDPSRVNVTGVW